MRKIDVSLKLADYCQLRSAFHYLIIDPSKSVVICHVRSTGYDIIRHIVTEGVIKRSLSGIELRLAAL